MRIRFRIDLTPSQREAYDAFHSDGVRELVLNFSRQQGKTTLCEILMIETLLSKRCTVYYVSPDFGQGKKVYREVLNLLLPTGQVRSKNSSDLTIETANGSFLGFFSAKNPTAIRGNTCSGLLVLDECAYLPEETPDGQNLWHMVIKPITKAKKPKVVFISTPNGKSGLFYDKYLEGKGGTGPVRTIECDVYRDSLMSPDEIEALKADTPPLAWRQEFLVEFLDSELTAFDGFERCFRADAGRPSPKYPVWIGVDFSAGGEDATILTVADAQNRTEQFLIEGSLDAKYNRIASLIDSYPLLRSAYLEANGIGEPMINEIRKLVRRNRSKIHYWETTHDSKNAMVGMLALMIDKGEIAFDAGDTELYREFGWFTYEVNKRTRIITYGAKAPRHDDRVMSLMMALQSKQDSPSLAGSRYSFVGNGVRKVN